METRRHIPLRRWLSFLINNPEKIHPMKRLVIFDLDGTLLNTIDDLGTAANVALKQAGYPTHPLAAYPYFVGNGVAKLIERALPEGERSPENVARITALFKEYYGTHATVHSRPYPGIPELLHRLADDGVRIAVASNKYNEATQEIVKHYFPDIPFAYIAGSKPGVPLKPDPSIGYEILGAVTTPKADVLYVGDSAVDMETARRACVTSCGVVWGFRPVEELRSAYANHIVATPEAVYAIVISG